MWTPVGIESTALAACSTASVPSGVDSRGASGFGGSPSPGPASACQADGPLGRDVFTGRLLEGRFGHGRCVSPQWMDYAVLVPVNVVSVDAAVFLHHAGAHLSSGHAT
jgi:hypothetical protein